MKRFIAIALCALMLAGTVITSNAFPVFVDETYTVGDADNDGKCNAIDSLEIKRVAPLLRR